MNKTELLAKVEEAGYAVLKDTAMPKSDEPPYSRHQLIIVKEDGLMLDRKMFNYLVRDDGEVFYFSSDPFAVRPVSVKPVFEIKLAEYMATLKSPQKVRSDDKGAIVKHFVSDGETLKEVCEYCTLDDKDTIVTESIADTLTTDVLKL